MTAIPEDARYTTEELAQRFPQGVPVEIMGYLFQDPAADIPMSEVRKEVERLAREIEARRGAIPEDVRKRADDCAMRIHNALYRDKVHAIASLILSEREAAQRDGARALLALEFVASMAWRTDPPNANNKLTDAARLSAIKFHPTVKALASGHIELAEREAAAILQEPKE